MTYPPTPTFWLEPTDYVARGLRRSTASDRVGAALTCEAGYHSALTYIERLHRPFVRGQYEDPPATAPFDDARWPAACDQCGAPFADDDAYQSWGQRIYRRLGTGEEHLIHPNPAVSAPDAPVAPGGGMWDGWWLPDSFRGPDGIALVVRLPNGRDWYVDSQASNCARPGQPHACWVRHGDPRTEPVTVDKNGDTCAAGAGSILSGDYHGFLTGGLLKAC